LSISALIARNRNQPDVVITYFFFNSLGGIAAAEIVIKRKQSIIIFK